MTSSQVSVPATESPYKYQARIHPRPTKQRRPVLAALAPPKPRLPESVMPQPTSGSSSARCTGVTLSATAGPSLPGPADSGRGGVALRAPKCERPREDGEGESACLDPISHLVPRRPTAQRSHLGLRTHNSSMLCCVLTLRCFLAQVRELPGPGLRRRSSPDTQWSPMSHNTMQVG